MGRGTLLAPDALPDWPKEQKLIRLDEPAILLTHFADWKTYHTSLIDALLEMEQDSPFCDKRFPGGCGVKIRDIPLWGIDAAALLHERALSLFRKVTGSPTAVADESWASIYHTGDYCMPHSHVRATASVVYLLDPGDDCPDDPLSGKLVFCDPRMKACCQAEDGRMTNMLIPAMRPGSMIIFPGGAVHAVGAYRGARPRITLSWNINAAAVAGKPRRLR